MRRQNGQIIILTLIFLAIILLLSSVLLGLVGQNVQATRRALAKEQALFLAEAGIDRAVWQLNVTGGAYSGETDTVLATGVFDVGIVNISATVKEITATGYVPGKASPKAKTQIKVRASIDADILSFNYAVQIGDGGLNMQNGSRVNGSIYSNGMIDGDTNARITGSAYSAGAGGRIFDKVQIDADAHAHQIDSNIAVGGSAYGNTLTSTTVGGSVFMYAISNCTVGGNASYTTKASCTIGGSQTTPYPGEPDPPALPFPISDQQLVNWKNEAAGGGTITGNYSLSGGETVSLGPKKITGDLILANNSTLNLTGRLWVAGNIDISNGAIVRVDASYAGASEVVLNDGWIHIQNNGLFSGSGTPGSYLLFANTNGCTGTAGPGCTHHNAAIDLHNNVGAAIIFAKNGLANLHNNVNAKELTAYKVNLDNNAAINYESGLANVILPGTPGGTWVIQRGTYRF